MPLSEGTMELGSCITRIIHQDDTLTNIIITPTCLLACKDYDPYESDIDNDSLDALNMLLDSGWSFEILGLYMRKLTNLTQLTFDGLDREDEELESFWGEISGSKSLTSLNYTNINLENCEEILLAACAPNITSITFQGCTIPNYIASYHLRASNKNDCLTTLCFIKCCFSNINTMREILEFATELALLTSITSFWFTLCSLDAIQSMCLNRSLQEERVKLGLGLVDINFDCFEAKLSANALK